MVESVDFTLIAKNLLSGLWEYSKERNAVIKYLGNNKQLAELGVIVDDNNLHPVFKQNVLDLLGKGVLDGVVGPFGDDDIFYGTDYDDETSYFIEMEELTDKQLAALQKVADIEFVAPDE